MARVASLHLPQLPIERLRRAERPRRARPEPALVLLPPVDDDPGACSVPRGGGWRPGASWSRDGAGRHDVERAIDALPAHQRPSIRELGRRSEAAEHPFRRTAGQADDALHAATVTTSAGHPHVPLVLVDQVGRRQVVTAACPAAAGIGLVVGMPATQARALVPGLDVRPADPLADAGLLERLAAARRAREEAQVLDRLMESLRLASFRNYLAVTVNSMSALVPAIVELAGSDVVLAAQRIRPVHHWPSRLHPLRPSVNARRHTGAAQYEPPAPRVGDAVLADGLSEWVEVAVAGASLDVVLRSDASELSTHDGMALLKLGPLPEVALQACPGRALDDVVDHPLLSGRGYIVDRAVSIRSRALITFKVGRTPLQLPWML